MLRRNQRSREKVPFQASLDGFFRVCINPEQQTTHLLSEDVGVNKETTTTNAQVAARKQFARPPKNCRQERVILWGAEQTKQFDPKG